MIGVSTLPQDCSGCFPARTSSSWIGSSNTVTLEGIWRIWTGTDYAHEIWQFSTICPKVFKKTTKLHPRLPFSHLDGSGLKPNVAKSAYNVPPCYKSVFFEPKWIVSGALATCAKVKIILVFVIRLFPPSSINRILISHLRRFREQMVHSNVCIHLHCCFREMKDHWDSTGYPSNLQRNKLFVWTSKKAIYDQIVHTCWW